MELSGGRISPPRGALSHLTVAVSTFGRGLSLFSFFFFFHFVFRCFLSCLLRCFRSVVIRDDTRTVVTIRWRRDCDM